MEHLGVQPDFIPDAKGLGKGPPVEATIAAPEIADSTKGLTISTFGGNPVATRKAKATSDRTDSESQAGIARVVGRYRGECPEELQDKQPVIEDVR